MPGAHAENAHFQGTIFNGGNLQGADATNADFTVTANHNVGKTSTGYVDTSAPGADGDLMGGQWTAGARLGLTGEL